MIGGEQGERGGFKKVNHGNSVKCFYHRSGPYKNGHYSLVDLRCAKKDIKNGKTYTEATENRNVSRSTLHAQ